MMAADRTTDEGAQTRATPRGLAFALWALLALALAGYVALVALPAGRANIGFASYYAAAHTLAREPQNMPRVYDDAWFAATINRVALPGIYDVFFYNPPTMSLMLLPLINLGPGAARMVWPLLGLALLIGGLALLARALALPARWGIWAAPFCLLMYAPITENVRAGQAYLLLMFLLCAAFWALAAPRRESGGSPAMVSLLPSRFCAFLRGSGFSADALAGAALGLMLALKAAGAWLWPLLLIGRRWRALGWAAGIAAGIALVSLPWVGAATWRIYLARLPSAVVDSRRAVTAYQTVTSLFAHLLAYDARMNPAPVADLPALARALTLAVTLAALAFSAWRARLDDEHHVVRALSMALCTALLAANAPFAEGYHYALALPALLTAIWRAWREGASRPAWAALALAGLLIGAPLPYKSARIQAGWAALLAYPRVYGAYLLWGWLACALARAQAARPAAEEG